MGGYPQGHLLPGSSYREFQERQALCVGCALPQHMADALQPVNFREPSYAGQGWCSESTAAGQERVEWPDWQDHIMQDGRTWKEWRDEAMESAMEKDWSEYVEKTRAAAKVAAEKYTDLKYNGEGRCHETGIEDPLAQGMGPNMVEMNAGIRVGPAEQFNTPAGAVRGVEPVPLKVGPLPPPPDVEKLRKLNDGWRAASRKALPLATGVLDYFPLALLEVARVSKAGNEQHNPGEPMHWAKEKSTDEADALMRHLVERGKFDIDGQRHTAKVAWRALALLQRELEAA